MLLSYLSTWTTKKFIYRCLKALQNLYCYPTCFLENLLPFITKYTGLQTRAIQNTIRYSILCSPPVGFNFQDVFNVWEHIFSTMKFIKSKYRFSLTDKSLSNLLKMPTTSIEIDTSSSQKKLLSYLIYYLNKNFYNYHDFSFLHNFGNAF